MNAKKETKKGVVDLIFPYGYKKDFKIIVSSSIPLILNNFSQVFLVMVSFIYCGRIGHKEYSAAALATTFINIAGFSILTGLATAAETLFPQIYGGINKKKMGLVLQKGVLISLLSCLPVLCIIVNAKHLLRIFIHEEDILQIADSYTLYYSWSILFYSIHIMLQRYVLSQNIFYPILLINTTAFILNAILHAFFIFVLNF